MFYVHCVSIIFLKNTTFFRKYVFLCVSQTTTTKKKKKVESTAADTRKNHILKPIRINRMLCNAII